MHIMHMLGVLTLVFFAALFLMCFFKEKLNNPIINPLLISACAILFFSWNYAMYKHNGLKSGFMTLDNISPYICTVIPLTPLMNKRVRDFAYCAIAFLSFGMFVAMFISPEVEYIFNYHQDAKLIHVSEAACHLIMAIYGFYLMLSGKVRINIKNYGKALAFIYTTIGIGVFLNFVFHRSYFGMAMHGKYSIYFIDIFDTFWATFAAYIIGVLGTITIGFLVGMFFIWLTTTGKREKELTLITSEENSISQAEKQNDEKDAE